MSLIYLPDLLYFQSSTDKYCLRCIFYPISIYLSILRTYPSVEIGGTRSSSFFSSSVVTRMATLFCSAKAPSWIQSIFLVFVSSSRHGSDHTNSPVRSSRVSQKNVWLLCHSTLGASPHWTQQISDISPLPPGQADPPSHPKQEVLSQVTGHKDQITASILTAAFTDFYHDF